MNCLFYLNTTHTCTVPGHLLLQQEDLVLGLINQVITLGMSLCTKLKKIIKLRATDQVATFVGKSQYIWVWLQCTWPGVSE